MFHSRWTRWFRWAMCPMNFLKAKIYVVGSSTKSFKILSILFENQNNLIEFITMTYWSLLTGSNNKVNLVCHFWKTRVYLKFTFFHWYITIIKMLPAVVKLKKNARSFVLRFLLEILAMAGKWTPWQAPRNTREKRITLNAFVWSEKR